jgi:hypothetical protein
MDPRGPQDDVGPRLLGEQMEGMLDSGDVGVFEMPTTTKVFSSSTRRSV